MAGDRGGSTLPMRRLGRELRELRDRAALRGAASIDDAMELVEWSKDKIWRIERGDGRATPLEVGALCDLYQAEPKIKEELIALAKESRNKAWFVEQFGDVIPPGFDQYFGLESYAQSLHQYDSQLILGLLQTKDYARAILRLGSSNEEEIDRKVELRLARQARLTSDGFELDLILDEATLRRRVGSDVAMAGQLQHLLAMSELKNVSIRLLPFVAGEHTCMVGSIGILSFAEETREPETAYSETYGGGMYIYKPEEVGRLRKRFDAIDRLALSANKTRETIAAIRKDFSGD